MKTVSKYYQADGTQTLQTNYQYDDQYRLTNIKFSDTNIAKMGCGIVAAHNAMYTCGRKALFVGLVTEFDYNLIIPGGMGIYWGTVAKCIRRHGFICDPYSNKEKFSDKITAKNPGILEADYKKKSGGHYIMIKKAGQKFRCYNVTGNVPAKAEDYNSIDAVMKKIGAKFKKGIIVRK